MFTGSAALALWLNTAEWVTRMSVDARPVMFCHKTKSVHRLTLCVTHWVTLSFVKTQV